MSKIIFAVVLFFPISLVKPHFDKVVFWNVGQGSWTTLITSDACVHVDAGGRERPLTKECHSRKNIFWFTHYDWDHIGLTKKISFFASDTCLMQKPPAHLKAFKKNILRKIPICKEKPSGVNEFFQSDFLKNNESSGFIIADHFLITGDSSQTMERKWLKRIAGKEISFLLAGHHGSRTSLSPALLKKLKNLRGVIISAEKKKYGHPHRETVEKLKRARIPMITTEDFGSIAIEL